MVVSLSSFSRIEGTTPKIGPRILARAKSSSDEGKSSVSIVDGNMGMLKERVAMIKLRERLRRGSRGSHGWNYMKSYESCESEIKRDVKFKEFVEVVELVFGNIGLTIVGCTILLCFVSFLVHL
ncbi:hypothetical protein J5N97_029732 [Dioscorea zingiberensis]|uniref:Uncharacterized protein n=1 Tax=Dioscorea zingiberensis TaxID=325984 RepID=A0A9D5BVZ7_9LILI|nr:hypothetical protein J5N97_029732 [Dioscorea zingiberensis]